MTSKVQESKHRVQVVELMQGEKSKGSKRKGNGRGRRSSGLNGTSKDGLNYHSGVQSNSKSGVSFSMAPTTSGVAAMTYRFMPCGLPNVGLHDRRFGVKVRGAEMIGNSIQSAASGTTCFAAASPVINGTIADLFTTGSRVRQFATIYGFMAIRRLKIHFVPQVSTTFPGLFAIAIAENVELSSAPNTIQLVSQNESATLNNAWLPKVILNYTYAGLKDYSTQAVASDVTEQTQFELWGAQSGMTVSTVVGFMFAEYEIDFYAPQSAQASIAKPLVPLPVDDLAGPSPAASSSLSQKVGPSRASLPTQEVSDGEEKHDDRELVVVKRQESRSSSVPPINGRTSTSVEPTISGSWFRTETPSRLSSR